MKINKLEVDILEEPRVTIGYDQKMEDPKDGLFLFGPLDEQKPQTIRIGLIGTTDGILRYKRWVGTISGFIESSDSRSRAFPGFETVFGATWSVKPITEIEISKDILFSSLLIKDRHQAIFKTVSLFEDAIRTHIREEDSPKVDVWFVVVPEDVYRLGRPKSFVKTTEAVPTGNLVTPKAGKKLLTQPSLLYQEDNEIAQTYLYEVNFHNQLKARLLNINAVVQIVRETSLTPQDFLIKGKPIRRLQDSASIAWNLCTTAFFKAGGRPWKLADVRKGVCYIGLVFKMDSTNPQGGNACCGAQMFLDSGDGLVFKGAVGPWYSNTTKEFHLPYDKAKELVQKVINTYIKEHNVAPSELFIHGRTFFNDEEWKGFVDAVSSQTKLTGIRIRNATDLKLYTPSEMPVVRGTIFQTGKDRGYLWTRGFVPQLETYPGREVPNPLDIRIHRGEGNLVQVMEDILGLTKVNFNACIFADGYPVTLRFADAVGEILTAAPIPIDLPPLPFRNYI